MKLNPVAQRFVLHWGEMSSKWGVDRTVAQIHALLFLAGKPLPAGEIAEKLDLALPTVNSSIEELQNWNLLRVVQVTGGDHFATSADAWELFRAIVRERKERDFDPTIGVLQDCLASDDLGKENEATQQRIRETLVLMESLSTWAGQMLRLETPTLMNVIKVGAKIQNMLHSKK